MRVRHLMWMLGIAVCLPGLGCGKKPTGPDDDLVRPSVSPTVQGAVWDEAGNGLSGAVVEARNPDGGLVIHSDTTNAQGLYRLILQGFTLGRDVAIHARRGGYRDTSRAIKIESSETIGIFLTLIRADILFSGRATDVLANHAPLSGVRIVFRRTNGTQVGSATTGGDGRYETQVAAVRGEALIVEADRVGFAPRRDTVQVQQDAQVVDFALSLAIVGEVKDAQGRAIAQAVVTTVGGTAEGAVGVRSDGSYVLTLKQDAGGDTVVAHASGFREGRQWVPFSRTAENRADFRLEPLFDPAPQVGPQSVAFGVLDDRDTLRISNATAQGTLAWEVVSAPAWISTVQGADSVRVGQTGLLIVSLLRDRLPAGDGDVTGSLRLGFNSMAVPELEIPISVVRRSISGRIADGTTGQVVAGVRVAMRRSLDSDPVVSGQSGADGRYALGRVPDGDYVLTAQVDGYVASALAVWFSGGQEIARDLFMVPFPRPAEMVYEGGVPFRILIDPEGDGDRAYILVRRPNPPDDVIEVVSGLLSGRGTMARGRDIRVGAVPTDGAFYRGSLLVACYGDTSVRVVNLNTDAQVRVPTSPGPFALAVAGDRAYVASEDRDRRGVLDVIDLTLSPPRVEQQVALTEMVILIKPEPWGPGVSASAGRVFVADNQEAGRVLVVDMGLAEPEVVGSLNVGGYPQAIVDGRDRSYVLSKRDPAGVTVIDRMSGTKVNAIAIADAPGFPRALALSSTLGRRFLYVVYAQHLVVYDLEWGAEMGRFRFVENGLGQAVSAATTPDGLGLLIGLEGTTLGKRLLFFRFGG